MCEVAQGAATHRSAGGVHLGGRGVSEPSSVQSSAEEAGESNEEIPLPTDPPPTPKTLPFVQAPPPLLLAPGA